MLADEVDALGHWLGGLHSSADAHGPLLLGVVVGSLLISLVSILALPWFLARLPEDYFVSQPQPKSGRSLLRAILRNVLGVALVLAGVAMLVLPGQGLITILVGVALIDFPGKHQLVLALARKPKVVRALEWLRRKAGRPPFRFPE